LDVAKHLDSVAKTRASLSLTKDPQARQELKNNLYVGLMGASRELGARAAGATYRGKRALADAAKARESARGSSAKGAEEFLRHADEQQKVGDGLVRQGDREQQFADRLKAEAEAVLPRDVAPGTSLLRAMGD
jgi:hypothetical protein